MLREKIECENYQHYLIRRNYSVKERGFMILYLLITFGISFTCYMLFVGKSNYFYNSSCPLDIRLLSLDLISKSLESLGDAYMGHKIIRHFFFFLAIKQKKLAFDNSSLTCFNRFMIFWILSIILFNLLNSFSRLPFTPFIENRIVGNEVPSRAFLWGSIDLWILNVGMPFSDMLT